MSSEYCEDEKEAYDRVVAAEVPEGLVILDGPAGELVRCAMEKGKECDAVLVSGLGDYPAFDLCELIADPVCSYRASTLAHNRTHAAECIR